MYLKNLREAFNKLVSIKLQSGISRSWKPAKIIYSVWVFNKYKNKGRQFVYYTREEADKQFNLLVKTHKVYK